ncbi:MAG: pilus assembly protein N-terminal domain-containing protein [Pseudomonadota bacterium]
MKRHMALFGALISAALAPAQALAGEIWLTMDYVRPVKLEKPAGRIVVGNPGIADVEVQSSHEFLLFANGPGTTNLFITDENGEKLDELIVRVRTIGDNMLIMQNGPQRTTYNCLDNCEATVTVGDGVDSFGAIFNQVNQKRIQAAGGPGGNGQ